MQYVTNCNHKIIFSCYFLFPNCRQARRNVKNISVGGLGPKMELLAPLIPLPLGGKHFKLFILAFQCHIFAITLILLTITIIV